MSLILIEDGFYFITIVVTTIVKVRYLSSTWTHFTRLEKESPEETQFSTIIFFVELLSLDRLVLSTILLYIPCMNEYRRFVLLFQ